jgi:hypothetical protein
MSEVEDEYGEYIWGLAERLETEECRPTPTPDKWEKRAELLYALRTLLKMCSTYDKESIPADQLERINMFAAELERQLIEYFEEV